MITPEQQRAAWREYLAWLTTHACAAPKCWTREGVEAAHVAGAISVRTGLPLPRRLQEAYMVAVPLCVGCHRTGQHAVHALGERGWERHHGLPEGWLPGVALTFLARYVQRTLTAGMGAPRS